MSSNMDTKQLIETWLNGTEPILEFPSGLTSKERAQIHDIAQSMNIESYSEGIGDKRHVIITRNIKQNTMTEHIAKTLIKNFKLPIPVIDSHTSFEVFTYFTELYEEYCNSKQVISMFEIGQELTLKNGMSFSTFLRTLENNIIDTVKSVAEYQEFNTINNKEFNAKYGKPNLPEKRKVYIDDNVNTYMISLDMKKGNFNSLRHFCPEAVFNCKDWSSFVDLFVKCMDIDTIEYVKESKYFRQQTLGKLNGKRLSYMQRIIQSNIYTAIIEWNNDNPGKFIDVLCSTGNDEMIIKTNVNNINEHCCILKNILDQVDGGYTWRVDPFYLESIDKKYYIKKHYVFNKIVDFDNYKIKFYCVPNNVFAQVYKHYYRDIIGSLDPKYQLIKKDLMFMDQNGMLAMYLIPLFGQTMPIE